MTPDDTNQTFLRRYVDDYCKALDENYKQDTIRSLEHNLQRDPECTYSAEQLVKIMQGKAKLDKFRYYEGKKYIKVVREEYNEREDRWRDTTVHAFIGIAKDILGNVYKPSGNTLTAFLRITISKMVDVRFVPQCSFHKKDRIKISFSFAVIFVILSQV